MFLGKTPFQRNVFGLQQGRLSQRPVVKLSSQGIDIEK